MNHISADLSKLKLVPCLYHRAYHTHPHPTLLVTVDGERKEFKVRWRAISNDRLYHSRGLKCVLVMYDDVVLSYEVLVDESYASIDNMARVIEMTKDENWYFDSEKFYKLDAVSSDSFLSVGNLSVIDPIHITYSSTVDIVTQNCFVICQDGNVVLQSPPISSQVENKNKRYMLTYFEQSSHYLSLTQLLKLCSCISKIFGPSEIERFDLPAYMIRHKTVNLGKLPVYVKDNSSTNLKPAEAITYLLGLMHKNSDTDINLELHKQLKSIARFGSIDSTKYTKEHIYTGTPVELIEYQY